MSHHSSSVKGEGTSHKDPLSRILDELSSLKLWKEKQERKEKGKKRVEEISQREREKESNYFGPLNVVGPGSLSTVWIVSPIYQDHP